jgi:lipid II isoglutaminyl synthase (glutamine-hydrolysing)
MVLRLLSLYPDQMSIYADRGNLIFLRKRCEWRSIGFELTPCRIGEQFDPNGFDLIYMGGGQDRDQRAVAGDLVATKRDQMVAAKQNGAVILAVCGGYQLLGRSYQLEGERIEGLDLVGLETVREPGPRLIGPVAITAEFGGEERTIAGFENHGGRTYLDPGVEPLGRVRSGHGNNGNDGMEGVREGNLIGTYLHGPLLPKNAWLADHLIAAALEHHHGNPVELESLDDRLESAAHGSALRAARSG